MNTVRLLVMLALSAGCDRPLPPQNPDLSAALLDMARKPCSVLGDSCCTVEGDLRTCQSLGPTGVPLVCSQSASACVECGDPAEFCCPGLIGYYCRGGTACADAGFCP
jgi:hypothetical protein